MTQLPHTTKLADPWGRWRTLVELATDCYALAGHGFLSEAELGEEYAIAAGEEYYTVMARAEANASLPSEKTNPSNAATEANASPRRQRQPRHPTPDGLKTAAQAAAKLGCSIKTLNGHIASGALRYVIIGHGKKHPRRMFTDADLDGFIANQTRKDVACPPTSPKTVARRISTTTSKCEVIGFTARRNARRAAKPKK